MCNNFSRMAESISLSSMLDSPSARRPRKLAGGQRSLPAYQARPDPSHEFHELSGERYEAWLGTALRVTASQLPEEEIYAMAPFTREDFTMYVSKGALGSGALTARRVVMVVMRLVVTLQAGKTERGASHARGKYVYSLVTSGQGIFNTCQTVGPHTFDPCYLQHGVQGRPGRCPKDMYGLFHAERWKLSHRSGKWP